eukprot:14900984-Heterocapsa_arctica.AAC.1
MGRHIGPRTMDGLASGHHAAHGVGVGKSGGTAILARPHLGLRLPEQIDRNPSQAARLTMGVVDHPGLGPTLIGS